MLIDEMSLEELREYAKNQDVLIATQKTELEDSNNKMFWPV